MLATHDSQLEGTRFEGPDRDELVDAVHLHMISSHLFAIGGVAAKHFKMKWGDDTAGQSKNDPRPRMRETLDKIRYHLAVAAHLLDPETADKQRQFCRELSNYQPNPIDEPTTEDER